MYSFVDLAFLLLIALSQLDINPRETVDLGEITIPRIATSAAAPLASDASERWQLSVHPPEPGIEGPFALSPVGGDGVGERLGAAALRLGLDSLRLQHSGKPLLVPQETSHSRDLLTAVALLEERWPNGRRAIIAPQDSSIADSLPVVSTGP